MAGDGGRGMVECVYLCVCMFAVCIVHNKVFVKVLRVQICMRVFLTYMSLSYMC